MSYRVSLLAFIFSISPFHFFLTHSNTGLQAHESTANLPKALIEYNWSRTDDTLYLDFSVPVELLISDNYRILKVNEGNGVGLEIECTPINGAIFNADDQGFSLKKITYEITLTNPSDRGIYVYQIFEQRFYENVGWFSTDNMKKTATLRGLFNPMTIDFEQEPVLFKQTDEAGYVVFGLKQ